ncbi:MAG: (d)CMP kinase, partial [Inconstantimicrobium porci]
MKLAVAIDGPAGAGKSTIAKILGKKFDLMYINTGAMYRAVTFVAMKNNIAPTDIETLCSEVKKMEMHFENDELYLNGE